MLTTEKAIIVEGKYDKIRLSQFVDAPIIVTDGFGIFKNPEKKAKKVVKNCTQKGTKNG